jgi:hypothetical protein
MWDAAIQHLIATSFYLAALLLFLRYLDTEAVSAYVASLVAMTLALLAKEEAVSLPLVCFLAELLLYPSRPTARRVLAYAPMAALLTGYLVVRRGASHESYLTIQGHYALGWHIPGKLWDYLEALAFPLPAHLVDLVTERAPWFAVFRGAAAAAILVALCAAASRAPRLLAFVLAWLLLAPVPFLPFTWGIQSRYAYLAAAPFCLLAALAVEQAWSWSGPRWRVAAPVAGLLAICLLFTVYNERSAYVTGTLSAQLMTELSRREDWRPGTTIVLVDSPLAANSVRPILFLSHPATARNVKVVNVATGSREYESAVGDPAAAVFVYERGAFASR